jgi:hypothetical protein
MTMEGRITMRASAIVLFATLALCAGCGSEPAGPDPETMAGTWVATSAQFVRVASPPMTVDVIPMGGSLVLILAANGTFTLNFAFPGEGVDTRQGNWNASFDVLTLNYTPGAFGPRQFDLNLSGNTLTLRGADVDFEFVGHTAEPAKLNLVLTRQ